MERKVVEMEKIDFKKKLKDLYTAPANQPTMVEVPPRNFLMVDGTGDPNNSQQFQDAVEVLYGVSYTLKFMLKKREAFDYVVMPLEGLWWADDMANFSMERKNLWKWTLMIAQPEQITSKDFDEALEQIRLKKNPSALSKMRFERLKEGLSAQVMHIGPYDAEPATVEELHRFIKEKGYKLRDKHHEIYLSDPRKTAPEKMKTILRQPME